MAPMEAMGSSNITFRYGGSSKGRGKGVGADGRRALNQPRGLCLAADGALLVTDFGNHCVYRFAAGTDAKGRVVAGEEGKVLPTVDPLKDIDRPVGPPDGEGRLLKQPVDAAWASDGGILVLDCEECRVQHFASRHGSASVVVPDPGSTAKKTVNTPEALKYPRSILPREDGSIIVCDTWSHRLLSFPAPGNGGPEAKPTVLAGLPNSCGARAEQLAFPSCVALAQDGALLVTDTNNHRIQRFPPNSAAGTEATTIAGSSKGEPGSGLGELNMPTGICIDLSDGSLLVADRGNARVLRFRQGSKSGDVGEVVVGSDLLQRPWGICAGLDGSVYVSDERQGTVLRIGGNTLAPAAADDVQDDVATAAPEAVVVKEVLVEEVPSAAHVAEDAEVAEAAPAKPQSISLLNDDPMSLD